MEPAAHAIRGGVDVDPHTQRVLSLCSGYGGLELALGMAGVASRSVAYVEREAYPAANLAALMEEGLIHPAPIWDNVSTFDGRPWNGLVEIVTAGFPCQPFSTAGKRKHLEDERWLWPDIERILRDVRPRAVFLENVPGLTLRGMGPVLGTLSDLGLDAEWEVVRANIPQVGAPHIRARVFILAADPEYRRAHGRSLLANAGCGPVRGDEHGRSGRTSGGGQASVVEVGAAMADTEREGSQINLRVRRDPRQEREASLGSSWPPSPSDEAGWRRWLQAGGPQPGVCRDNDGLANRVERLRMLGNGVCPQQAAHAFETLWRRMCE
jgi:DNA (cytosine-5)-methyltransferase 1